MSRRFLLVALLPLALFPGLLAFPADSAGEASKAETPRLIVLVYIDQLRGDYLTRWDALFGEGGFHRLEKDGAWFQNCHYPYSDTVTAAGHASVATGCSPRTHGIVGNDWYDRAAGASVNCVSSVRYQRVPPAALRVESEKDKKPAKGVSPERLLAPTIGDALKEATGGKGRVVSLSLKNRSAVLPGGQRRCLLLDGHDQRSVCHLDVLSRRPASLGGGVQSLRGYRCLDGQKVAAPARRCGLREKQRSR